MASTPSFRKHTSPEYSVATRAAVCLLKAINADRTASFGGFRPTGAVISSLLEIPIKSVSTIYSNAKQKGFDPTARPLRMEDTFFISASRSGRPKKVTAENQGAITKLVCQDKLTRNLSSNVIACRMRALGHQIASRTVNRLLHAAGFKKLKPIRKPGLTAEMKADRLDFCLRHAHWTLENWKNVIWTDETSIQLSQRGSQRVWVRSGERYLPSTTRSRWKGYSEFMFWGAFSYDKKGPCHVWKKETKEEREEATEALEEINKEAEPICRAKWEAKIAEEEAEKEKKSRKQWKFTDKTGMFVRKEKEDIDGWRYQKIILREKLLPFAAECKKERPNTVVLEDGAPAHSHWYIQKVYDEYSIEKLQWPGNSPDLNQIEPIWPWLKRKSQCDGITRTKKEAEIQYPMLWYNDLPQERLQRMVERMPGQIEKVITELGGNLYQEGRRHGLTREEREQKMAEWGELDTDNWENLGVEVEKDALPHDVIRWLITE